MLPIYQIDIINENCGVEKISLVDNPAVQSNFLAFSDEPKQVLLSVENEEKQMVTGVLARCDYPIYRKDEQFGEYYIQFGAEVIEKLAQKMLHQNHQNDININHIPNSDIEGVEMVEMFVKNTEKGINPKGFEDISDGSLFATYKVNNTDVWNAIKNGEFKGFSIEGMFDYIPEKKELEEDTELNEIMALLEELYKRTHNI